MIIKRILVCSFLFLLINATAFSENTPDTVSPDKQNSNTINSVKVPFQVTASVTQAAALCSSGYPQNLFFDDFENGSGNWQTIIEQGSEDPWTISTLFPSSGSYSLQGLDLPSTSLTCKAMISATAIPANTFLHFQNAYDFEYFSDDPAYFEYFDGGIVEYSTDGGASWSDAGSLFIENGYNDIISGDSNPLGNRSAFVGFSQNYLSSKLSLSTLAGQNVLFRFCIGTDSSNDIGSPTGWFIDDVQIYICSDTSSTTTTQISTTTTQPATTTSTIQTTTTAVVPTTTTSMATTTTIFPPSTSSIPQTSTIPTTVPATTIPVSSTTSTVQITTTVPSTTTTSAPRICPFVAVADGDTDKLSLLRQFRDTVLWRTPAGREYVLLFYRHSFELTTILYRNPSLLTRTRTIMNTVLPNLNAALKSGEIVINPAQIKEITRVLNAISSEASPALKKSIQQLNSAFRDKNKLRKFKIKIK